MPLRQHSSFEYTEVMVIRSWSSATELYHYYNYYSYKNKLVLSRMDTAWIQEVWQCGCTLLVLLSLADPGAGGAPELLLPCFCYMLWLCGVTGRGVYTANSVQVPTSSVCSLPVLPLLVGSRHWKEEPGNYCHCPQLTR